MHTQQSCYVSLFLSTYICIHTHTHVCTYMYTYTHTHTHMYVHAHTHTNTRLMDRGIVHCQYPVRQLCVCIQHAHTRVHIRKHTRAHTRTHACTHTPTHTCIYKYTHAYTYTPHRLQNNVPPVPFEPVVRMYTHKGQQSRHPQHFALPKYRQHAVRHSLLPDSEPVLRDRFLARVWHYWSATEVHCQRVQCWCCGP